jgi:hypothetical protein
VPANLSITDNLRDGVMPSFNRDACHDSLLRTGDSILPSVSIAVVLGILARRAQIQVLHPNLHIGYIASKALQQDAILYLPILAGHHPRFSAGCCDRVAPCISELLIYDVVGAGDSIGQGYDAAECTRSAIA